MNSPFRPLIDLQAESIDAIALCVLVVEDEAIIRMDLVSELEAQGFRVYEASDGRTAIERFRSQPNLCGVVVDIGLPGETDG